MATAEDELLETIQRERAEGLAKSWRGVTQLLDAFRLPMLTPEAGAEIAQRLASVGLRVMPPIAEADRHHKVRLLLPGEDPDREQDLVALDLIRVTRWEPGQAPVTVALHEAQCDHDSFLWIELNPAAEVGAVWKQLGPLLEGLSEDAVEDLVEVDDLPSATAYGVARKVSTVGVFALEADGTLHSQGASKAGQLAFQMVEMLVGPGWILSCWHEPRGTRTDVAPVDAAAAQQLAMNGVVDSWVHLEHPCPADAALLLIRELSRSYVTGRRAMYSWLEQWELEFHRRGADIEQETLRDLRVLASEFHKRLNSLNESQVVTAEHSWFPGRVAGALDAQLDTMVDRSIEGLVSFGGMLRSAVDLLTNAGIREHLRLAEVASEKADKLQDQVGLVASLLLVPTFIAGFFGANTEIPGQGKWWGFMLMLVLMAVGAVATYAFFQRIRHEVQDG